MSPPLHPPSSLPILHTYPRSTFNARKSHNNENFLQTYSEIEKLLKDSKRQISALHHAENAAAIVNTSPKHGANHALGDNSTSAGLRRSFEWKRPAYTRRHYLTKSNVLDEESPIERITKSSSLAHLPISLRNEIAKYKHDVEEYLELEKRVKVRKQVLRQRKRKRKKEETISKDIVAQNAEHVTTRDELLQRNLEKLAQQMPEVRQREQELTQARKEQIIQQIDRKNQWVEYLSVFSSPKDREKYVYSKERQRQLWVLIVLSRFVAPLEAALFEHRVHNAYNLTNLPSTSEREQALFNMHKRRLFMEIRRREQNPLDLNPFVAHLKYSINRKHVAAQMIRTFCTQVAESKVAVQTMREYMMRIRQCQRYVQDYLVCKKARLYVMRLQLEKFQREQQAAKIARMEQKLKALTTAREHIMDRKKKIARLKEKFNDPGLFFDFPDIVTNKLLAEHLQTRTRRHIAMLKKMKSLEKVPRRMHNFTLFSRFIKTKTRRAYVLPTTILLTQDELKDLYQDCISETKMLADAKMVELRRNGVLIRRASCNIMSPKLTSPKKQQPQAQQTSAMRKKPMSKLQSKLSLSKIEEENNIELLLQKMRQRANAANYHRIISNTQLSHSASETFLTSVDLASEDSKSQDRSVVSEEMTPLSSVRADA